ncbi:hypothetical protein [Pseudoalteromonas sp. RW-H-Ap-1]|uniref:hypothetical protein n=1 Tax=Pseudoalteromonas sp. RW-H-Ap-1 TaxID=3241171 RepID=UPI00390C4B98
MNKKYLLCLLLLASAPMGVNACEFHSGVGLNQFHPFARQHFQPPILQNFSFEHAKQAQVKVGTPSTASFSYLVPKRYSAVSVKFVAPQGIKLTGKPSILLERTRGIHSLKYVANKSGKSEILVQISGLLNTKPFTLEQKIEVTAS